MGDGVPCYGALEIVGLLLLLLLRASHVKWRYTKYLGFSFLALAFIILN